MIQDKDMYLPFNPVLPWNLIDWHKTPELLLQEKFRPFLELSPVPLLPWSPIPWEDIPQLPWPHKMVHFATGWSRFYPCNQCGFCCHNAPLIKVKGDNAYYLPKSDDGYCIMYDKETRECKIYNERPLECRLLVCKAPESVKERLEGLLIEYLREYGEK